MIEPRFLLFIEPQNFPSKNPLIDDLTKKMTASLRLGIKGAEVHNDRMRIFENSSSIYPRHSIKGVNDFLFLENNGWCGFHRCVCGVFSGAQNFLLSNGELTNSLCVHYLAYHRSEVPQEQLNRVAQLSDGMGIPSQEELNPPKVEQKKAPMTRTEYLQSIGE